MNIGMAQAEYSICMVGRAMGVILCHEDIRYSAPKQLQESENFSKLYSEALLSSYLHIQTAQIIVICT